MTVGYIPVPGTWGDKRPGVQWFDARSPLSTFLSQRGLLNLCANALLPYGWSTDLDFTAKDHAAWQAGGEAFNYYLVPPFAPNLRPFPASETVVVDHSHGIQVVAYACADGLKIDRLIDICGPVRKDMWPIYERARPNIRRWLHVYSDWRDYIQIAGELSLGKWQWPMRKHPFADENLRIPKVGHSGLLYDPPFFPLWESAGLIHFLQDAPAPKVAA